MPCVADPLTDLPSECSELPQEEVWGWANASPRATAHPSSPDHPGTTGVSIKPNPLKEKYSHAFSEEVLPEGLPEKQVNASAQCSYYGRLPKEQQHDLKKQDVHVWLMRNQEICVNFLLVPFQMA